MKSQFIIAAAHSGAGKTTVTLGLLRAFRQKGYRVQPFKCGPDFIDPIHHRTAAGRDSINLDRFMMSDAHIRDLYDHYSGDADISITEGVMGLFDGAVKAEGSSAGLAKLLGLPVILVLNADAMAYSAAAILYGLKNFDPEVNIAGVIFNFVETAGHYGLLQEACADVGVKALGYLPRNDALRIPSRHLGLDTGEANAAIDAAAGHLEKQVGLGELLSVTRTASGRASAAPSGSSAALSENATTTASDKTILIARDAAFQFLYPENIRRLQQWGKIHYFSPLEDGQFPISPDLLYLPGGYPELYLEKLAGNLSLLSQLQTYAAGGGKILAECGGMMYLGRSITDEAGKAYRMAGILDIATSMEGKKLSLGYRKVILPGGTAKGHEFHYSGYSENRNVMTVFEGYAAAGKKMEIPFIYTPGLFASYLHFYWGEEAGFLEKWLALSSSRK